jgi:hypothetical protein
MFKPKGGKKTFFFSEEKGIFTSFYQHNVYKAYVIADFFLFIYLIYEL